MTVATQPAPASIEPIGPPRPKTTADVLRHAARLIEERGWCQDEYEEDGRVCMVGAINGVTHGDPRQGSTVEADRAWCFMDKYLGCGGMGPAEWNDTPGRSAAEVIAALRAAADAA